MMSTGRARPSANASGWARASVLGTSSPNTIVNSDSRIVTTSRPTTPGVARAQRRRSIEQVRQAGREAHAGERRREEPDERHGELDDREEPARVAGQPADAPRAAAALVDHLLHAARPERHERDLRGDEDAVEEDEQDDDAELDEGVAHQAPSRLGCGFGRGAVAPVAVLAALGAVGRISRMRAGTPTASLPGGTSLVTTAPGAGLASRRPA